MSRVELKEKARHSMIGKYGDIYKLLFLYLGITYGIVIIFSLLGLGESIISLVASLVWGGLSYFGYNSFFLKLSRNEEVTYKELFSKTKLFWPCLVLSFLIGIFTLLWSFLFIIPGIIASFNYSIAYFVALDNPELGAMDILRKSKEIMDGHKMDYFILGLSFLGWYIVGFFTFGLLYIWLVPYALVTFANFYNEICE